MKHLETTLAALLALSLLFACKKEEEKTTYVKLSDVDMYLTPDSSPVKDNDGKVLLTPVFSSGDEARILFGTSRNEPFTCSTAGSAALFKFSETGSYAETSKKTIVNFFKAIYPSSISASVYSEDITLTLPSRPVGSPDLTNGMNVQIGRSKDENIRMHNAVSFIRFKVAHEGIYAVTFISNADTVKLSGQVRYSFDKDGLPVISQRESASKSISVYAPDEAFEPGRYYYVAVLPCDLTSCGYSILYQARAGYYSTVVSSAVSAFRIGYVHSIPETDAALPLVRASAGFSASADGDVFFFAQGNLQYDQSALRWQIAPHQYDYIGNAGGNLSVPGRTGIVDLFCWSTDAEGSGFGLSATPAPAQGTTSGEFNDWSKNTIYSSNGTPLSPGMWFTPTRENFRYILRGRYASTVNGVQNACFAKASVSGVSGILLFPDVFVWPSELTLPRGINSYNSSFSGNAYSAEEFAVLEEKGVIFLPAAGYRTGCTVDGTDVHGYYWTSTGAPLETSSYALDFSADNVATNAMRRSQGFSVRLVSSIISR